MASSSFLYCSSADADTKRRRLRYEYGRVSGSRSKIETVRFDISNFLYLPNRPGEVFVSVPTESIHDDNDPSCWYLEGLVDLDGCVIFYLVFDNDLHSTKNNNKNKIRARWTYQIGRSCTISKIFEHTFDDAGGTGGERVGFFRWIKHSDIASNYHHHLDHHGNLVVDVNIQIYPDEYEDDSTTTPFDHRHQNIRGVDE